MLTNGQKKALHAAARKAGVDEWARREIQRQIGGFYSAADRTASREGFIAVMAHYEGLCEQIGVQLARTANYWRDENAKSNPTDALVYRVGKQAREMGLSPEQLDAFVAGKHMTNGQYPTVNELPMYWLIRLTEALKTIFERNERKRRAS